MPFSASRLAFPAIPAAERRKSCGNHARIRGNDEGNSRQYLLRFAEVIAKIVAKMVTMALSRVGPTGSQFREEGRLV